MRILLTGTSSFTGLWFARALQAAGHDVWATFQRQPDDYTDVRRQRVQAASTACHPAYGCSFGDEAFVALLADGPWDCLCHHAADVTNYKSPDFDVAGATANNTRNLPAVLAAFKAAGGRRVMLTGSVFEADEGAGSGNLHAFSPYGVSKGLTWEMFRYYAADAGLHLGKFVIPNPFGPYEEPRFTAYLVRTWMKGETAGCKTPDYVRDNIHVSLLARAYAQFVSQLPDTPGTSRLNPSGYVESQGTFAQRFAAQLRPRLGLDCQLELSVQTEFSEPRMRVNTDPATALVPNWDESAAWDELATYYQETYAATATA